jgi:hypothetical protein
MWPLVSYFDYYRTYNFQHISRTYDLSRLETTRPALPHGTGHMSEET